MKRISQFLYVMMALAMAHVPAVAQNDLPGSTRVPRWVPESGYWVAENNVNHPKLYTIYFYTDQHVLIYKENIEGVRLNLKSVRVKMRLKKVLEKSLLAWHNERQAKENEGLVISLLQER